MVSQREQVDTSKVSPEKLGEPLDLRDSPQLVKEFTYQETEIFSSDDQVKDSRKISILMNFYGLANFIPLMAVLSNMDYFIYKYSVIGQHPEFIYNMIVNFSFVIGGQTFAIKLLIKLSYLPRLIVMFIPLIIVQIALPFVVQYIEPQTSWNVSIFLMVLFGSFMGNINSTFTGIGGLLGSQYMGSYFQGLALSSIVACILRLICLLLFDSSDELSYFYSTLLYFALNTIIQIIVCLTLPMFLRLNYVKHHLFPHRVQNDTTLNQLNQLEQQQEIIEVEEENRSYQKDKYLSIGSDTQRDLVSQIQIPKDLKVNYFKIFQKIWAETTMVFFSFLITYLLYPGITFQGGLTVSDNFVWNIFYYNVSFNVSDYIGRCLARLKNHYGRPFIIIFGLLRCLLIASTFIIAFNHQNVFWGNNAVIVINSLLIGITHGFLGTCCNQSFAIRLENHEKEHGGFLISVIISLGVAVGSLISLVAFKDMF